MYHIWHAVLFFTPGDADHLPTRQVEAYLLPAVPDVYIAS